MATWNSFYLRISGDPDSVLSAIEPLFPAARIESGEEFIGVILPETDWDPPAVHLERLSGTLSTEVFWLSFQSAVDAFQYHHWRNAGLQRSLVYGCYEEERIWERAEGEADPWESEVLFSEQALRYALEDAGSEDEKKELERRWHDGEIVAGHFEPSLDSRETAWKVAEYYQFPGWSE